MKAMSTLLALLLAVSPTAWAGAGARSAPRAPARAPLVVPASLPATLALDTPYTPEALAAGLREVRLEKTQAVPVLLGMADAEGRMLVNFDAAPYARLQALGLAVGRSLGLEAAAEDRAHRKAKDREVRGEFLVGREALSSARRVVVEDSIIVGRKALSQASGIVRRSIVAGRDAFEGADGLLLEDTHVYDGSELLYVRRGVVRSVYNRMRASPLASDYLVRIDGEIERPAVAAAALDMTPPQAAAPRLEPSSPRPAPRRAGLKVALGLGAAGLAASTFLPAVAGPAIAAPGPTGFYAWAAPAAAAGLHALTALALRLEKRLGGRYEAPRLDEDRPVQMRVVDSVLSQPFPARAAAFAASATLEEALFRGLGVAVPLFIMTSAGMPAAPAAAAVVFGSSLLFAAPHKFGHFLDRFVMGAALAALYLVDRSLVLAALAHFLFNWSFDVVDTLKLWPYFERVGRALDRLTGVRDPPGA